MSRFNPTTFRSEVDARGLTLRELGRISGVHEVSLSRYGTGLVVPTPRTVTKLAISLARIPRLPVDLTGGGANVAINDVGTKPEGDHGAESSTG